MGIEAALIGGGAMLGGSLLASQSAKSAASSSADAQRFAAQQAADAARFRPVGIRTGFGTSTFGLDEAGNLASAGYQLTPELEALRNRLITSATGYQYDLGQATQPLTRGATGLFGLAEQLIPTDINRRASPEAQALAQRYSGVSAALMPSTFETGASPEAQAYANQLRLLSNQIIPTAYDPSKAAAEYITQQQAVLEPTRQAQLSRIRNQLAQSGRTGLSIGGTESGNIQAANPELAAYYNALAQQDLGLAATATDVARQRLQQDIGLGVGLGGQALTAQQQSEAVNRANMLQNLGLSLGYGTEGYRTQVAGEDLARQRFAQDLGLGTGLFNTGAGMLGQVPALQTSYLSPLQNYLGLGSSVEGLGQGSLDIGAQLGGRAATAGSAAGQALLTGGVSAARAQQADNAYNPWAATLTGFGTQFGTPGTSANQLGSWFQNYITRQSNQASPDFIGPIY